MRAITILTVAALGLGAAACQVTEDKNNHSTSVEYNDQVAANAVADVGNTATNIAGTIAADAKREVGKVKVRVDAERAEHNAATANRAESATTNKQ